MKKNKLLSLIGAQTLQAELQNLGSTAKIAAKYQVNLLTVYNAFKIIGIDPYVRARQVDQFLTKEQLQQDYGVLQSFRKIGEKYGISRETVRYYVHKYKLDYNHLVIYDCDHAFFSRENEASFYVAGFIAADGCVKLHSQSTNSFQLQIGLAAKDRSLLAMIKGLLKTEAPIFEYTVIPSAAALLKNPNLKPTKKVEVTITSKQIFHDLAKFSIVPRKTLIYTFPTWLINHPLVNHFMRGYADGDGSFYLSLKKDCNVPQVYFDLKGTENFLRTYRSILSRYTDCNGYIRSVGNIYDLEYGGNGVLADISRFLYRDATLYLPRKYDIIKHFLS